MASLSANSRRTSNGVSTVTAKDQGLTKNTTLDIPVKPDSITVDGENNNSFAESIRQSEPTKGIKWQNVKVCNERSDSGFSETPYLNLMSTDYQANSKARKEAVIEERSEDKIDVDVVTINNNKKPVSSIVKSNSGEKQRITDVDDDEAESQPPVDVPNPIRPLKNLHLDEKLNDKQKFKKPIEKISPDLAKETSESKVSAEKLPKANDKSMKPNLVNHLFTTLNENPDTVKKSSLFKPPKTNADKYESAASANLNRSQSLHHHKPTIDHDTVRRSDFTNTIQMRKKSLENSAFKERLPPTRSILKPTGKVFNLLQKFTSSQPKVVAPPPTAIKKSCIDVVDFARDTSKSKGPSARPIETIAESKSFELKPPEPKQPATKPVESKFVGTAMPAKNLTKAKPASVAVASVFNRLTPNPAKEFVSDSKQSKPDPYANQFKSIADAKSNARTTKINGTTSAISKSTNHSPPFNRTTENRLSARVKEVTERLSIPKSPKLSTSTSSSNGARIKIASPKSPKISKDKFHQCRNIFSGKEAK